MVSITLSVPEDIREIMKRFPEINWSGLVRKSIIEKAQELKTKEELLSQLSKEREFSDWAVRIIREGRQK